MGEGERVDREKREEIGRNENPEPGRLENFARLGRMLLPQKLSHE